MPLKILALEPYHGGSHQAFLDGWARHSRHAWTVLGLPAHKWKWRMRHAAITLSEQTAEVINQLAGIGTRPAATGGWDLLICSDMLNLAEFRGLAPPPVARLPAVAYFHENQLTYPVRVPRERDLHFAMSNLVTALAADAVWFNSQFHRDSFLDALGVFLSGMPDYQLPGAVDLIRARSVVHPPGIESMPRRGRRGAGPLHVLWAARWEHDKNPDDFFAALRRVRERGVAFRLSVIGQQFQDQPAVFEQARAEFAACVEHWGYQPNRTTYENVLLQADVIVSTADHEFFGISVVEAIAAGCYPLLPRRLAYPELLADLPADLRPECLYDGSPAELADRLCALAGRADEGRLWGEDPQAGVRLVEKYSWSHLAPRLDTELVALVVASGNGS